MTTILDSFLSIWYYWMFASLALGLLGFGIIIYIRIANSKSKSKIKRTSILLIIQMIITYIIGFGSLWIMQTIVKQEVVDFLHQPDISVEKEGFVLNFEESRLFLNDLKELSKITAHHSHPTVTTEIILRSNDKKIILKLRQDSDFEDEYWVFCDNYSTTSNNEIGRIRTKLIKNGG